MKEMPTMSVAALTSTAYTPEYTPGGSLKADVNWLDAKQQQEKYAVRRVTEAQNYQQHAAAMLKNGVVPSNFVFMEKEPMNAAVKQPKLRVVRVFLVDPDERVPVDQRMLHKSDEMITDATDDELFFKIPVQTLIDDHNKLRNSVEWEENGPAGVRRVVGLKPIQIRDLSMQVTVIAAF